MIRFPLPVPAQGRVDVVGLGVNAVDHLCVVQSFPRFDSKVRVVAYSCQPGGQVATALVALQRWGLRTAYVGTFGGDAAGELSRASLAAEGIDLSGTRSRPREANQVAVILIEATSGERTILWHRPRPLTLEPREVEREWIVSARFLHLDGVDVEAARTAATWARESGVPVAADLDTLSEGVDSLLPLVDVLFVSREFAEGYTGRQDPEAALRELAARSGATLAGVTLGAEGAVASCQGRIVRCRGFQVQAVDTTGAGDVFHAGIIYALIAGWPIEEGVLFANAAAALKCRRLGGRPGIPSVAEARALAGLAA